MAQKRSPNQLLMVELEAITHDTHTVIIKDWDFLRSVIKSLSKSFGRKLLRNADVYVLLTGLI